MKYFLFQVLLFVLSFLNLCSAISADNEAQPLCWLVSIFSAIAVQYSYNLWESHERIKRSKQPEQPEQPPKDG